MMKNNTSVPFDADQWLTIREVAASLPGRPHVATVTRWTQRPVRGHILPSKLVGGKRLVNRADLFEFLNANEEESQPDTQDERHAVARAQVDALLN